MVLVALWLAAFGLVLVGYRPGGPWTSSWGSPRWDPRWSPWPPSSGHRSHAAIARSRASRGWRWARCCCWCRRSQGSWASSTAAGRRRCFPPSSRRTRGCWRSARPGCSRGWALPGVAWAGRRMRRRRLLLGGAAGAVMVVLSGSAFATAAIVNELALGDRPANASRFGPVDPEHRGARLHGPRDRGRDRTTRAAHGRIHRRPVRGPGDPPGRPRGRQRLLDGVRRHAAHAGPAGARAPRRARVGPCPRTIVDRRRDRTRRRARTWTARWWRTRSRPRT